MPGDVIVFFYGTTPMTLMRNYLKQWHDKEADYTRRPNFDVVQAYGREGVDSRLFEGSTKRRIVSSLCYE